MSSARTALPGWGHPPTTHSARSVDWSRLGLLAVACAICVGSWTGVALLLGALI